MPALTIIVHFLKLTLKPLLYKFLIRGDLFPRRAP